MPCVRDRSEPAIGLNRAAPRDPGARTLFERHRLPSLTATLEQALTRVPHAWGREGSSAVVLVIQGRGALPLSTQPSLISPGPFPGPLPPLVWVGKVK
jgi:hypothetical protein